MNDTGITLNAAKWIKGELYCKLTGHTRFTLQKNRQRGIWTEGVHFKQGPEGVNTYYYNLEEIDKLITKYRNVNAIRINKA